MRSGKDGIRSKEILDPCFRRGDDLSRSQALGVIPAKAGIQGRKNDV
jgi:hypothetical protein